MTWKLKKGVTWHDGKPFTADDVRLQLGVRRAIPRPRPRTIGSYTDIEKIDDAGQPHRAGRLQEADARSGPTPSAACDGMIIPKHLFEAYKGEKSREAPNNLKPVGTGPYKFVDFKPGDIVRGEHQPELPRAQPAVLRLHRDEGRRRRGLGRARGHADRRVRLRLEHAGGGRDPQALRAGRPGQGRHRHRRQHRAHPAQQHRPVEGGGRRALQPQDQASLPDRPRGPPGAEPAGGPRPRSRSRSTGAPRITTAELPERARRASPPRTRSGSSTSTRPTRSWRPAGWKKGADGIRAKDGKKLKMVYQTSINAPRQKTQADRQAGGGQGGHRDRDQVGHRVGVLLLRPGQPGHLPALLHRHPDVHGHPDHAGSRRRSCSSSPLGGRLQGEQVAGPQHHPLAERGVRQALQARPRTSWTR